MKRQSNIFLLLLLGLIITVGACSSDVSEEMPASIQRFVTQYFPNMRVKSYAEIADRGHLVELASGPTLRFDSDNQWTDIDGNGALLPEVLMYDQLPTQLYDYLQSTEQQNDVTAVKRDSYYYKLTMPDTVITYDIATGDITYPGQNSSGSH